MNTIYTIGYGRCTRQQFAERITTVRDAGGDLVFIDVRLPGSRSRNGKWAYANWAGIWTVLTKERGLYLEPSWNFGNPFGNSKNGFHLYKTALLDTKTILGQEFSELLRAIQLSDTWLGDKNLCLLCAEHKPFKPSGAPNCHRVILAEELVERLGNGWMVEHIGDNREKNTLHNWFEVIKAM